MTSERLSPCPTLMFRCVSAPVGESVDWQLDNMAPVTWWASAPRDIQVSWSIKGWMSQQHRIEFWFSNMSSGPGTRVFGRCGGRTWQLSLHQPTWCNTASTLRATMTQFNVNKTLNTCSEHQPALRTCAADEEWTWEPGHSSETSNRGATS